MDNIPIGTNEEVYGHPGGISQGHDQAPDPPKGKLEESVEEYSSGLVLVPYHHRIKKFMDKWGAAAQTEGGARGRSGSLLSVQV